MPRYEYRCQTCDDTFELRRAMAAADDGVECPAGHTDVRRLLSVFAMTGSSAGGPGPSAVPAGPPRGGCGGACACAH